VHGHAGIRVGSIVPCGVSRSTINFGDTMVNIGQSIMRRAQSTDIEQVRYRPSGQRDVDLEVFSMSDLRLRVGRAHLRRHHRYNFHMFVCVARGVCRAVVDFSDVECRAGSLLTIKPGQVHRFGLESRWDALILLFRPELLQTSQTQERLSMPELVDALPTHMRLEAHVRRLVVEALSRMKQDCDLVAPRPILNMLLQGDLAALVARLHILYAQQPPGESPSEASERFRRFKQLVDANVHQWHHVSRYAQSMGCSERTLTRTCSAAAGIGAKRFIALRLALDAKRILAHTEVPIVAIAERLGFDDATNFIKFFRGVESCTPGDFRRRMARDDQRARS
jgi:AraC-like DNA-binding protein/quercetin dioxygenase-like cupin family protein